MRVSIHGEVNRAVPSQRLRRFRMDARPGQIRDECMPVGMKVRKQSGTVLVAQKIRLVSPFLLIRVVGLCNLTLPRRVQIPLHHLGCVTQFSPG